MRKNARLTVARCPKPSLAKRKHAWKAPKTQLIHAVCTGEIRQTGQFSLYRRSYGLTLNTLPKLDF